MSSWRGGLPLPRSRTFRAARVARIASYATAFFGKVPHGQRGEAQSEEPRQEGLEFSARHRSETHVYE